MARVLRRERIGGLGAIGEHDAQGCDGDDRRHAEYREALVALVVSRGVSLLTHVCQIGRAHVCTPVTHAHLVCRLLLVKKNIISTSTYYYDYTHTYTLHYI